ncbi:MAG: hypothetical protein VX871_01870 [Pseudomonadota bacterium]|nr:hypothetical protein [Pseudomonadota bacterium]
MTAWDSLPLTGPDAPAAFGRIVDSARNFARSLPGEPPQQSRGIKSVIAIATAEIRAGLGADSSRLARDASVIRLHKESVGGGRLKLQLFPLQAGESHPPHAHDDLLSCQIVLVGRVRMREYSLLGRVDGDHIEVQTEPEKLLGKGEGTYTLQMKNNIHWQEGLEPGTVLLNVNWQGYLPPSPMSAGRSQHGRCYLAWEKARPGTQPDRLIVPELPLSAGVRSPAA